MGIFLKSVLRENNIPTDIITQIAICSVVPNIDYSLNNACKKYFDIEPFILQVGVKTGLKIKYRNPIEVGADRIANAIAVTQLYPNQNAIIVDFGTATTFCAITKDKDYLGGAITAGLRLSSEALQSNTAKLSSVAIKRPENIIGRSTVDSLQSGLYYGHLGMIKEITQRITEDVFSDEPPIIIGTGGFAGLFEREDLFTKIESDLVLHGLRLALCQNIIKQL